MSSDVPHAKSRAPKQIRRRDANDFDERWGDEEPVPAEEPQDENDFTESPAKRVKLSHADDNADTEADKGWRRKRSPTPPPPANETAEAQAERERQRDLRDRDEFAKRLARKDDERAKKIVEDRSAAKDGVAAQRGCWQMIARRGRLRCRI